MRITAVLCVRNEEKYLAVTLSRLVAEGLALAVIDNDSTDRTPDILDSFRHAIVHRSRLPFRGCFDLTAQLAAKQRVYDELQTDWLIHCDADEVLQSPRPDESLRQGIERIADRCNVVNFEEFVFVPTSAEESHEGRDYCAGMLHYYHFAPEPRRLMRAWMASANLTQIHGGHALTGPDVRVAPENFLLRHYPLLSLDHARRKYPTRVFASDDLAKGWHLNRTNVRADRVAFPPRDRLKSLRFADDREFDRTDAWRRHFWEPAAASAPVATRHAS